jgi:hypothetical protein
MLNYQKTQKGRYASPARGPHDDGRRDECPALRGKRFGSAAGGNFPGLPVTRLFGGVLASSG